MIQPMMPIDPAGTDADIQANKTFLKHIGNLKEDNSNVAIIFRTVPDEPGNCLVIGPKFLDNVEVGHKGVTNLHIVASLHERKAMMYDTADAFIIFPGGLGTLDETMEIITWRQLGLHQKPIIIVNLNHYWDSMLIMFQNIIDQGFMHHGHTGHFEHVDDLDGLMDKLDFIFKSSKNTG